MTSKTLRELNLDYWGRNYSMCENYNELHGTDIKPWQCVKVNGVIWDLPEHPIFDVDISEYSIAVAIIESVPVFTGDKVYSRMTGDTVIVYNGLVNLDPNRWTMIQPKLRLFELNGQQLPCPVRARVSNVRTYIQLAGNNYHFNSAEDRDKVALAIVSILDSARDKD